MLKKYKVKTEQNIMMWKFISPTEAQKSMLKKKPKYKKVHKSRVEKFQVQKKYRKRSLNLRTCLTKYQKSILFLYFFEKVLKRLYYM